MDAGANITITILRKFVRKFIRANQHRDVWPVVLLLFAVLVPAVCLLWFMAAAMRNERLAAQQKLAAVYRVQLSASQAQLQQHWNHYRVAKTIIDAEKRCDVDDIFETTEQ